MCDEDQIGKRRYFFNFNLSRAEEGQKSESLIKKQKIDKYDVDADWSRK